MIGRRRMDQSCETIEALAYQRNVYIYYDYVGGRIESIYTYLHIYETTKTTKMRFFWPHSHFSSPKYTHFREGVEYICTYDNNIDKGRRFSMCILCLCVCFYYIQPSDLSLFYSRRRPSFFLHYYRLCICMKARIFISIMHISIYIIICSDSTLSLLLCVRVDFLFLISHFVAVVVVWWGHHSHFYNSVERSEWWRKKKREKIRWDEL